MKHKCENQKALEFYRTLKGVVCFGLLDTQESWYNGCNNDVKYELLWDSYDDKGNPIEPDTGHWRCFCEYIICLTTLIKEHPYGSSVDYLINHDTGEFLSLSAINKINKLSKSLKCAVNAI